MKPLRSTKRKGTVVKLNYKFQEKARNEVKKTASCFSKGYITRVWSTGGGT